ncbi:MAG: class E sortase [Actinobacteria bacterium]|nr:class E sortase [Actinomycetota bacterium]
MTSGSEFSFSPLARFNRYRRQRIPFFPRPELPHDWRWVVAGVGKTLITVGLLMFAFVGYQLWGTGIQTAQAQNRLEREFDQKLAATTTTSSPVIDTTTTIPGASPPDTTVPAPTTGPIAPASDPVLNGDAIAILRIPRIGVDWRVVEGVRVADLKDGPGHFRETVMPGQLGNSAIAGHRTTQGHPFRDLDRLAAGDLIEITTLVGTYTYAVTGSMVVKPSDYSLVIPTVDPSTATLALVTCDPAYTARNRLIVQAVLVADASSQVYAPPPNTQLPDTEATLPGEVIDTTTTIAVTDSAVAPPTTDIGPAVITPDVPDDAFSEGWFSDSAAFPHALAWGALLATVGFGSYFAGRAARRLYVCFLVGVLPFTVVLYFFFENVNRLLPPSL